MNTNITPRHITFIGSVVLIIIALFGIFATIYFGGKVEIDERDQILSQAVTIATLIDPATVESFNADQTDLENPTYGKLKAKLAELRKTNSNIRFIYLMGQRATQQFFYVDSEDPASPDYSYPGQIYESATETDTTNFINAVAYTKGPYQDAWGFWFTAYAPILDRQGNVVANLGIDIDAEKLLLRVSIVKSAIVLIFSLIFLSALAFVLYARAVLIHADALKSHSEMAK